MLSLKDRVHAHWSDVRSFGRGLRLAWVGVTSVAFGAILFYTAPQAQDLLLEVRGSLLSGTLFWTEFYLLTLFAWALPVYVSSRWILSRFDRQALLFGAEQLPVDDWVRQWIPPLLAALCFGGVLIGQISCLRDAPPDLTREGSYFGLSLSDNSVFYFLYMIFAFAVFWWFVARLLPVVPWTVARTIGKIVWWSVPIFATAVILFIAGALAWASIEQEGPSAIADWVWNNPPVEFLIVSASALLVVLLVWWDRRGNGNYAVRLLSWIVGYELTVKASIGTAIVLNPILLASLVISVTFLAVMAWELGTSQIEDMAQSQFNIAHVVLLPFITLLVGLLVWFCLRPRGSALAQSTTDALLARVFYVMLTLSVAILFLLFFIHPVDSTRYVYRALLMPFCLGLLVPVFTYQSYWSARWQAPIVISSIIGIALVLMVLRDRNDLRMLTTNSDLTTLDESVKRWAVANECDLGAPVSSAQRCPSPFIVSAAGGASRASFLVASVVGKLLDEDRYTGEIIARFTAPTGSTEADRTIMSSNEVSFLFDVSIGQKIAVLKQEPTDPITSAVFSPSGARLITMSSFSGVRLWDGRSGAGIAVLDGKFGSASFNASGDRILTTGVLGTPGDIRLWDGGTGVEIATLIRDESLQSVGDKLNQSTGDRLVQSAIFNSSGDRILTRSISDMSDNYRLWDSKTGTQIALSDSDYDGFSASGGAVISEDYNPWERAHITLARARSFSNQVFAFSGVSGGALAAVFTYAALADSLLEQTPASQGPPKPPCKAEYQDLDWFAPRIADTYKNRVWKPHDSWRGCLQLLTAGDFLSPIFASVLSPDLFGIGSWGDRAAILEQAWERRYSEMTGKGTLAESMLSVRARVLKANPKNWLPILLLNGTSVGTGRRIITSDVDTFWRDTDGKTPVRVFRDAYDLREMFASDPEPGKVTSGQAIEPSSKKALDIRLSTGASTSARFPIISPHGNIRNSKGKLVDRVVDGGYFENFGAGTSLEIAQLLEARYKLKPFIILINNDPATSDMECISAGSSLKLPEHTPRISRLSDFPCPPGCDCRNKSSAGDQYSRSTVLCRWGRKVRIHNRGYTKHAFHELVAVYEYPEIPGRPFADDLSKQYRTRYNWREQLCF